MAMADDQQQPGQPPAGAPGSWPPPAPDQGSGAPQPGFPPPPAGAPAGWAPQQPQQQPPTWGQQPAQQPWGQQPPPVQQPPAWQPPQQPWGQQPPAMGGYPPAPGGYPPPPYGGPAGYPPPAFDYGPRYAGFWIRFVAWIIDLLIWGFALTAAFISIVIIIGLVLVPLVFFGYFPFLWWRRGATIGQSLMGLRVVRAIDGGPIDGGMAAIRGIVFYAEKLLAFFWGISLLGFVWAAFEPRKRAWHDMAAGTVVIHVN
jgi:uncharacterized RDD family membrane protein YckC